MKCWTEQEIEYLKENYPNNYSRDIAEKLNRTTRAILLKAYKLGLK